MIIHNAYVIWNSNNKSIWYIDIYKMFLYYAKYRRSRTSWYFLIIYYTYYEYFKNKERDRITKKHIINSSYVRVVGWGWNFFLSSSRVEYIILLDTYYDYFSKIFFFSCNNILILFVKRIMNLFFNRDRITKQHIVNN